MWGGVWMHMFFSQAPVLAEFIMFLHCSVRFSGMLGCFCHCVPARVRASFEVATSKDAELQTSCINFLVAWLWFSLWCSGASSVSRFWNSTSFSMFCQCFTWHLAIIWCEVSTLDWPLDIQDLYLSWFWLSDCADLCRILSALSRCDVDYPRVVSVIKEAMQRHLDVVSLQAAWLVCWLLYICWVRFSWWLM